MAYWGIALALGPNINAAMDKTDERRAWEALQKARSYSAHVTLAEQAYITAIGKRYTLKGPTRAILDKAYADAMRVLWKQFPEDPDAGVLFAEALMDLHPGISGPSMESRSPGQRNLSQRWRRFLRVYRITLEPVTTISMPWKRH